MTDQLLEQAFQQVFTPGPEIKAIQIFPVEVGKQPLRVLIDDARLNSVDRRITPKRFPANRHKSGVVNIQLLRFNHPVKLEEVIRELEKRKLSPGDIFHLLSLGAQHPHIQQLSKILAPGSICEEGGDRFVPCLQGCLATTRRELSLMKISDRLPPDHWLVAVPPP